MLAASDASEVFALLEGGAAGSRRAVDTLAALFGSVREPWFARGLLAYHARTGSTRALDVLARAPAAHALHLLDALLDQLRAEPPASRHHALAALAALVARRPPWLHRLAAHPLAKELMRSARTERSPGALLHALLALAALLPAAPALASAGAADLAGALLRPASLDPPPAPVTRAHLHVAQRALFVTLYATHPCTLVEALRGAGAGCEPGLACVRALADCVRLHPALVGGSRAREADPARWARRETHDVLADCHRLALHPLRPLAAHRSPPRSRDAVAVSVSAAGTPVEGSAAQVSRAAGALRPGDEGWFALGERCGADSAPNTPLPADADAAEPPEAAVEATPENTPARETRAQFRFPADSAAVRAIGRRSPPRKETSPSAPLGEGYASRLARMAVERRAVDSPVPFAEVLPPVGPAVARPEPSRASLPLDVMALPDLLNGEDREVLELTAGAAPDDEWADVRAAGRGGSCVRDPRTEPPALTSRRSGPAPRRSGPAPRRSGPAPRRSSSCGPRLGGPGRCEVAVQTVDTWPEPHEFLVADMFRAMPDETKQPSAEMCEASERLDAYMRELYAGTRPRVGGGELVEQLALAHAQLMYERWRREVHAERNRRLLGRCRQVRALELHNAALQERVRTLARERAELRASPAPAPGPAPGPGPGTGPAPGAADALECDDAQRALRRERAARLRAEAALREGEAGRAQDAAELQRSRGESFEAARHVEALARAALAAERRAERVRRLRRELLLLGEREARLGAAARGALAAGGGPAGGARQAGDERAALAGLARAEADAEAAAARAELAGARVHELEAQVATRDAQLAELKRSSRLAAEEHAAQVRALDDKYAALLRVLRATEVRALERLAGRAPPARRAPPAHAHT